MVSELIAVKIELATIKIQQLQTTYAQVAGEQRSLIEQARQDVGAPPDHVYNLDTRSFHPPAPSGPVPLSTTAARQAKRAKA